MASKAPEHLQEKLDALPTKPGVYLMKDAEEHILYVGKAVNLRARVRSYFHASAEAQPQDPAAGRQPSPTSTLSSPPRSWRR